jgi:hypothetical protein
LVAAAALLLLSVAGCGGTPAADTSDDQAEVVSGLITDVRARSLSEIESMTLAGEDGETWVFGAQNTMDAGFTPSHLNEHMVLGMPVKMWFHRQGGALVIDRIADRESD